MRIAFYYFMGAGGGAANIGLLLTAFARTFPNDKIEIFCHPTSDLALIEPMQNLKVHLLKGCLPTEARRLVLGVWRLQREAQFYDTDVIWSVNLGTYLRGTVPQVISMHNAYQAHPWREVAPWYPGRWISLVALRFFTRLSLASSRGVIVQTRGMAEEVQNFLGRGTPIRVIPKPLESEDEVMPEPLPDVLSSLLSITNASRSFTFLYVATPSPHKNHLVLVEAFHRLATRGIRVCLVLTVSADELERIGGKTARVLVETGILIPVGWVRKKYLRALYAACDACLMPSLLESQSSAHLEAMGWGKPQVVVDLPYARNLCGDAALYARPRNVEDWARLAEVLMKDADLRARLIVAGTSRAAQFPTDWADAARRVREFLGEVAET